MKKERIKSLFLSVLILVSLVQVGILINFPSFLNNTFLQAANATADQDRLTYSVANQALLPYRLIISDGDDSSWSLDRRSDEYSDLWDIAQRRLGSLSQADLKGELPLSEWSNLILKQSYLIEFKTPIKAEILSELLSRGKNIPGFSTDIPDIYKLLFPQGKAALSVSSAAVIGSGSGTGARAGSGGTEGSGGAAGGISADKGEELFFMLDGSRIYIYSILAETNETGEKETVFEQIVAGMSEKESNESQSFLRVADPKNKFGLEPDILCVIMGNKYRFFQNVKVSIPEAVLEAPADLEKLSRILLGNEKDGYDRKIYGKNTIVFNNLNNIFRIYEDGILEYRFIPGAIEQESGNYGEAYFAACEFIAKLQGVLSDTGILYLSQVVLEQKGIYRFYFDYFSGKLPFEVDFDMAGKDGLPLKHAIEVTSNGKRVIDCRWALFNIAIQREELSYDVNFANLMDRMFESSIDFRKLKIKDIFPAYVYNGFNDQNQSSKGGLLSPIWIAQESNGTRHAVPMYSKGNGVPGQEGALK